MPRAKRNSRRLSRYSVTIHAVEFPFTAEYHATCIVEARNQSQAYQLAQKRMPWLRWTDSIRGGRYMWRDIGEFRDRGTIKLLK